MTTQVSPFEAIGLGFRQYGVFHGRATRAEYWWWALFIFIGIMVLSVLEAIVGVGFLVILFEVATLLPSLAVTARRLHDIDRTGWWQLGCMVGVSPAVLVAETNPSAVVAIVAIGIFLATVGWWLVWMVRQGESGRNRFGPDPRA